MYFLSFPDETKVNHSEIMDLKGNNCIKGVKHYGYSVSDIIEMHEHMNWTNV